MNKTTYIFNIESVDGLRKVIITDSCDNLEDSIQEAKVETLSMLKDIKGKRRIN